MRRCCSDGTDSAESRERAGAVASSSAAWGKEENDSSNWEVLPENDNDEEFMACKTFLGPKTGTNKSPKLVNEVLYI